VGIQLQHLPADVLGLSDVALTALADRPSPKGLPGMIVPEQIAQIPRLDGSFDADDRLEIQQLLLANLANFKPHIRVQENLDRLGQPEAALVIAGQQPAFLGGPLYNIFKVVTAIRLAKELSELWKVPVLPAFWNHADDHDIAEVHHLWIQTQSLELRKVGLSGASSGRAPLSTIEFDQDKHHLAATEEILNQGIPNYGHREEAIELFMPRTGETFSNAFTRVMLELFGEHGLIVIEPDWIREPLSRSLAHVVGSKVKESLQQGANALREVGSAPAIDESDAAMVFHLQSGKRQALRLAEDGFRYDGEAGSRTPTELAAEIIQAPADYSAGALLRPIIQDRALPNVAYVGGWGELAYHAQIPSLRKSSGVRQTAFVPRLSASILDPAMDKSLAKLKITAREALLQRGEIKLEETDQLASPMAAELRSIGENAKLQIMEQKSQLGEADMAMGQQLKKVASQVRSTIDKLADKVERNHSNTQGTDKRHARRVQNGLFPRGKPQERIRGPLEICAHFGKQWIADLIDEVEPLPTEHVLVRITEENSNEA
jgi:bacillithiol biosynthesis cysteine-adding enzyme BshC